MANLIPLINTVLSKELQALIYFLGYWSQKNRFKIYGMGGFVRDLVLGRENRVIDLLVDNYAVDFARSLKEILPAGRLRFDERLGAATLFLPRGIVFNMVTAKRELNYLTDTDTDLNETMLKNELYKKNFTINTMACAFNPQEFGRLYDYFGGRSDLEEGMIRVLYGLSFVDDPCRILQAIRFEQRFGFTLEENTITLLFKALHSNLLQKISKEKLYNEVRLIFLEPSPLKILMRLEELNLFGFLFPRLLLNEKAKIKLQRLEQIFAGLKEKKLPVKESDYFILFLNILFDELGEHDMRYLCYFLRLKRKERLKIIFIRENLKSFMNAIMEDQEVGREKSVVLINSWLEKISSLQH